METHLEFEVGARIALLFVTILITALWFWAITYGPDDYH